MELMAKYVYECAHCGHKVTLTEKPQEEPKCCGMPMRLVGVEQ